MDYSKFIYQTRRKNPLVYKRVKNTDSPSAQVEPSYPVPVQSHEKSPGEFVQLPLFAQPLGHSSISTIMKYVINPYKPGDLFVGHRQTVQNQIRCNTRYLIRFSTVCLQKCLLIKNITQQPLNWKWTRPIDKDGKIH